MLMAHKIALDLNNTQPKPSQMALRRQLNAIKRERFPWMLEVTKCAPQLAIMQLGDAFKNFFAGRARYPQARQIIQEGGSHALENFSDYLPSVVEFLGLAASGAPRSLCGPSAGPP